MRIIKTIKTERFWTWQADNLWPVLMTVASIFMLCISIGIVGDAFICWSLSLASVRGFIFLMILSILLILINVQAFKNRNTKFE